MDRERVRYGRAAPHGKPGWGAGQWCGNTSHLPSAWAASLCLCRSVSRLRAVVIFLISTEKESEALHSSGCSFSMDLALGNLFPKDICISKDDFPLLDFHRPYPFFSMLSLGSNKMQITVDFQSCITEVCCVCFYVLHVTFWCMCGRQNSKDVALRFLSPDYKGGHESGHCCRGALEMQFAGYQGADRAIILDYWGRTQQSHKAGTQERKVGEVR